ncbi:MAG: hypothetical protein ING19_07320 [Azospirillum sp.]|nr:hypothetical protein [Azospirillum sp.]MCA3265866.1 hypothetical protein [Azospirillum sp.]
MIAAIAALFLAAGFIYEAAAPEPNPTAEFLASFYLPGTPAPAPSAGASAFIVRGDDGVWRPAPAPATTR